jgi:hypothetical protein
MTVAGRMSKEDTDDQRDGREGCVCVGDGPMGRGGLRHYAGERRWAWKGSTDIGCFEQLARVEKRPCDELSNPSVNIDDTGHVAISRKEK